MELTPIKVRMPDGVYYSTLGVAYSGFFIVKIPCNSPPIGEKWGADTGLRVGEYGLYLEERKMWFLVRSEESIKEVKRMLKNYILWRFGNYMGKFTACIQRMKEAGTRKEANQIRLKYIKKYGYWTFAWFAITKTEGLSALLGRADEFDDCWHKSEKVTEMKPQPLWYENKDFWV